MQSKPMPPKGLPPGFRPIWAVLRAADEAAESRAVLSKRLGVSTHTIQRILVDGDVPHFGKRVGPRQSLAWARTITRLAVRLGAKPRSWIESAGIAWTEEVAAASRTLESRLLEEQGSSRDQKRARPAAPKTPSVPAAQAPVTEPAPPGSFPSADPALQRVLAQRLLSELWKDRAAIPDGASSKPRSLEQELDAIVSIARTLIAPQWRGVFEEEAWSFRRTVLPQAELPESPPHHCFSCSQSLQEHPGRSALYCRDCSDEEGRLRPREEVHTLIARWMQWWQPNLADEEARRRATAYMSAMPAWSGKK